MSNELGIRITPDLPAHVIAQAARAMAEMAVEVIIEDVDTPHRFPSVDEVSYGQSGWIMRAADTYLRRRGHRRSEVDGCVWEAIIASKVAQDYAVRARVSGRPVDRVRVWRAYEDAARWSRLARG